MKKLTKRQIILAGVAATKVVYPNVEHSYFAGVCVGSYTPVESLIKTSMGRWNSEELMESLNNILAKITCAKADEQCNGIIEECQKQIKDAEAKAVALYPCEDDEARKYITFSKSNWYDFELGNSKAYCHYSRTHIRSTDVVGYGDDTTEVRLLFDFYSHPINHKASESYAKQIKECEQRIAEAKDEYRRITLEDFIDSGRCAEVLKSMGINEF